MGLEAVNLPRPARKMNMIGHTTLVRPGLRVVEFWATGLKVCRNEHMEA